ncbi:MAG: hypothetical protein JWM47_2773 [Acidimicrobiales bacterium]|nr:hypothetical protein [Acidimicrobiales bacterium]
MFKLLFLPFKLAIGVCKLSGVKGTLLLLVGVGVGLLVAPQRGAQLRAQLLSRVNELRGGAGVPADTDLSL